MFVVVGLRSIPRIMIKHVLAVARDEICKVVDLHTCFIKFERASIPSVNVMVLCICWILCLFTQVYATLYNALWPWLKYGLSTCSVFYTFS